MRALPDALAAAAADAGVRFCYGAPVTALERSGDRVVAVRTDAERIACDAVILTTELPQTYALLGRTPASAAAAASASGSARTPPRGNTTPAMVSM
ncbi:FAD-dependent oxidoreductase [Mycobacterium sp. E1319]|uniref:FAD-dependent oxidoreductase n=1 Tax=Mycobacterium sp. E1319 TaxID=1834124 RepID=UPI0035126A3C